jgi:hypothetical protein
LRGWRVQRFEEVDLGCVVKPASQRYGFELIALDSEDPARAGYGNCPRFPEGPDSSESAA